MKEVGAGGLDKASGRPFDCFVVTPPLHGAERVIVAAARAGAVGFVDVTDETDGIGDLLGVAGGYLSPANHRLGCRLQSRDLERFRSGLEAVLAAGFSLSLIVADRPSDELLADSLLATCEDVFVEAYDLEEAEALARDLPADVGMVLVGAERGGASGRLSAFLFAQAIGRLKAHSPGRRILVSGAIGPLAARAMVLAGADGICLSDETLLFGEMPLPDAMRSRLARLDGTETVVVGAALGRRVRFLAPASDKAATALVAGAERLEADPRPLAERSAEWDEILARRLHWQGDGVLPLGQGLVLTGMLARRYRTVGRLVTEILASPDRLASNARIAATILGSESPLAGVLGTTYPVIQGPMTRVSDDPAFAEAVAEGGALPGIALAVLDGPTSADLLRETARRLGGKPFAAGLLGFVDPALHAAQMEAVAAVRPPFAVLAGGRPDQCQALGDLGVTTFLHAPSPRLANFFRREGIRRLIAEGRECGGHIGPIHSLPLWEAIISDIVAEGAPKGGKEAVDLVFAGGIHDDLSAAMVAAMAAPLAELGHRAGLLVGTAYLATEEAVATGALTRDFQAAVVESRRTGTLVSALGHENRCLETPYVAEFDARRKALLAEGRRGDDLRGALDDFLLGRLRLASKGLERRDGSLAPVDADRQREAGMFMAGDAACLIDATSSIEALHRTLTDGAVRRLAARGQTAEASESGRPPADVAIIGMSVLLPGAQEPEAYWQNILGGKKAIREIPPELWDWRIYYDPNMRTGEKSLSRWGGFFEPIEFDPLFFGIPPASLPNISPAQLLTLQLAQNALVDAGYEDGDFDRQHTSVFVAAADSAGLFGNELMVRTMLPSLVGGDAEAINARLPEWREETFAGTINSIVAGRIANRLDLGGTNVTLDAACASGLTALSVAIGELADGRANLCLVGGIDFCQTPQQFVAFSNTGALSPDGTVRAFDKKANGTVISEGGVVMVLKRLADAERDGDRIYGVVKGVATSSDGRALGLTAPRPVGQMRALKRAYGQAGFPPTAISYYEAHGTGTPVGDEAELTTISKLMRDAGARADSCVIGSVKALIGHTKTASGLASLAKVLLSTYHRVLPPQKGVEEPIGDLAAGDGPVFLLDAPRPWIAETGRPRRAGLSAFGFGGTNCHVVVEEYARATEKPAQGGEVWPAELLVLTGADGESLKAAAAQLHAVSRRKDVQLADLAYSLALGANAREDGLALAMIARSLDELRDQLSTLASLDAAALATGKGLPAGVRTLRRTRPAGRTAFLFPGQGAQATGMGLEAALYLPEVFAALQAGESLLSPPAGALPWPLAETIYPPAAHSAEARAAQDSRLSDTRMAQPAIGALSLGLAGFLARVGVEADAVAGHSFGEFTALAVAGALEAGTFMALAARRGATMAEAAAGAMAAVFADDARTKEAIAGFDGLVIANLNGPQQTVVSGPESSVVAFVEKANGLGLKAQRLDVAGAFHSPLMNNAAETFGATLGAVTLAAPQRPVFANRDGGVYPSDPEAIRARMAAHMVEPVDFVSTIEAMWADGVRTFIEVGPGRGLGNLTRRILAEQPDLAVHHVEGRTLAELLSGLADLWAAGHGLDLPALFAGRKVEALSIEKLAREPERINAAAWRISGSEVRPLDPNSPLMPRRQPLLTVEARDEERRREALKQASNAAQPGTDTMAETNGKAPPSRAIAPSTGIGAASRTQAELLEAYQAHQQTMRQFLATEERVLAMFLQGTGMAPAATVPARETPAVDMRAPAIPMGGNLGLPEIVPSSGTRTSGHETPASPSPAAVATAPTPQKADATPAPAGDLNSGEETLSREAATELLVGLVAEVTGYPTDMIDPEQDLEADLGVDSLKRLEVVERLRLALPPGRVAALKETLPKIAREPRLTAWIDAIAVSVPQTQVEAPARESTTKRDESITSKATAPQPPAEIPPAPPEAVQHTPESPAHGPHATPPEASFFRPHPPSGEERPLTPEEVAAADCPAYLMQARAAPAGRVHRDRLSGLFLVAAGNDLLSRYVAMSLSNRGADVVTIDHDAMENRDRLLEVVDAARAAKGPVRGLVHMAGTRPWQWPATLDQWRTDAVVGAKSLFTLLQRCLDDLLVVEDGKAGRVLAVTAFGGTFLRGDARGLGSPLAGAAQGLLKSVAIEHPQLMAKCIDVDPQIPAQTTALQIVDECCLWGGRIEIGFPRSVRTVFDIVEAPVPKATESDLAAVLPDDAVVVVSGGAKGITAATALALVRPGMHVALLGRSAPTDEADWSRDLSPAELREALIQQAREGGKTPVPAEIERALGAILGNREVGASLAAFQAAGVDVSYHSLDVRDAGAVADLMGELRQRHGRVDAILHGAGVIEDKLLADKAPASFDRVFDTKVDGLYNLLQAVPQGELKLLAVFSSIAGRFGNRGQSDYGAANETLNRIALHLARTVPETRVVAFNWGPWGGAGMASEAVNRQFRARGILPIPLDAGTDFARRQIAAGKGVEVIAGRGPWSAGLTDEADVFEPVDLQQGPSKVTP